MRTTVLLLLATLHAASFSPPAGPSIFSDAVIQPQPVPATGGEVSVSAVLSDPAGVTAGWVQLRYTDGDEQRVALTRQSGTATQGTWGTTFSAKPNFADFGHYPSLVFTAKNASGVYSRSENIQLRQAGRNPAGPRIAISSVPAYLSSEWVSGVVYNVDPGSVQVGLVIFVPGYGYVSKPYCFGGLASLTRPNSDGTWSLPYWTGGNDRQATFIGAYVFPDGAQLPCVQAQEAIPTEFLRLAIAADSTVRSSVPGSKIVHFGGDSWRVKAAAVTLGPGSNYFSSENVFADAQGLHFKLTRCQVPQPPLFSFSRAVRGEAQAEAGRRQTRAGPSSRGDLTAELESEQTWCAAEAILNRPAGYGTYTATLSGRLGQMAADVAGGLFTWSDDKAYAHREIDLEFWRDPGSDAHQHQFVVQPYSIEPPHRYSVPMDLTVATFQFTWEPSRITYSAWRGSDAQPTPQTLLATWAFDRTASEIDVPPPGDQEVHFNLWLKGSRTSPPSSYEEEEVVMNAFRYEPLGPGIVPDRIANSASYSNGAVSPGMLFSVSGYDLSPSVSAAGPAGTAPTELGGTRVLFDGILAPILFSSYEQVTAIVPSSVAGKEDVAVVVENNGQQTAPMNVPVLSEFPGAFTLNASGRGQGVILNAGGGLNGWWSPAHRNGYVTFYLTGVGAMNPVIPDGQIAGSPPPVMVEPVTVKIGGKQATVSSAGAVPGLSAGVAQITVLLPADAPIGDDVPVLCTVGGRSSQGALTMSIR